MGLPGIFFNLWRGQKKKKKVFQVMLFSMLHYSIPQSNNSILVHQRFLPCLIVYDSLLLHICCSPHFPRCYLLVHSLVCSNHGDGSLLGSICSGLEVKGPIRTSSSPKCKRRRSGRALGVTKSQETGTSRCPAITRGKHRAAKLRGTPTGSGATEAWVPGPHRHFLAERPRAGHITSLTLSCLFHQVAS